VYPKGKCELYDIEADRTEQNDLAARFPDRVKQMAALWAAWAKANYAIPWISNPPYPAGKS
jgi:arylsulfatase